MICSLLKYVFAGSDVNQISAKVSVQQWDLPLTINTSLNGCEWQKNTRKNPCSRCFWQKMKSWWTLIKISVRALLIFAAGWALCGRPQLEHKSVMRMRLLSLSPIKTLRSVRKHLQKVVCFILFIYSRAFNNNVISNGILLLLRHFVDSLCSSAYGALQICLWYDMILTSSLHRC